MPIFPDIRLVFLEEPRKSNQEKLCSQDFPEISFLGLLLDSELLFYHNFAVYKMGEQSEFPVEVLEDVSPSCSFLIIESFLQILRCLFFKTITMLRSFNWNVFCEQTPLFRALLHEQSYMHSQELRDHKHCQIRRHFPKAFEGRQSHPTGGL